MSLPMKRVAGVLAPIFGFDEAGAMIARHNPLYCSVCNGRLTCRQCKGYFRACACVSTTICGGEPWCEDCDLTVVQVLRPGAPRITLQEGKAVR